MDGVDFKSTKCYSLQSNRKIPMDSLVQTVFTDLLGSQYYLKRSFGLSPMSCCPHFLPTVNWLDLVLVFSVCPGGLEAPCNNHGNCSDGLVGSGKCICQRGFKGVACELCLKGFYGPNCTGRLASTSPIEPYLALRSSYGSFNSSFKVVGVFITLKRPRSKAA